MSKQDQPFFPQNNGMLSIAENRIEDLHRAVDRIAQKQAEYHGYTNAGIKNIANTQSDHAIELTEILLTQNEALTQIARALRTLIERGEE